MASETTRTTSQDYEYAGIDPHEDAEQCPGDVLLDVLAGDDILSMPKEQRVALVHALYAKIREEISDEAAEAVAIIDLEKEGGRAFAAHRYLSGTLEGYRRGYRQGVADALREVDTHFTGVGDLSEEGDDNPEDSGR